MRIYYDIESGAPISHPEIESPVLPDVLKWETMGEDSVWSGFFKSGENEFFGIIFTDIYDGRLALSLDFTQDISSDSVCWLIDLLKRGNSDSIISQAALRSVLKKIYAGSDVYISADDNLVKDRAVCLELYKQIFTNIDLDTAKEYVFFANCECYDNKRQLALVPVSQADLWFGSFPADIERFDDDHTTLDSYTNYVLSSEDEDRSNLIALTEKYGKYIEDESVNKAEYIYAAFIDGNIDYLMDLCYKYAVDMHSRGEKIEFESGVKALLSTELKNQLVIKIIYNGYKNSVLSELLRSNGDQTAFCAAVRDIGELFENDEIDEINAVLFENSKDDNLKNQLTQLEKLEREYSNPFEAGMIVAYRKYIESLNLKKGGDIENVDVDGDISAYYVSDVTENVQENVTAEIEQPDDTAGFNALFNDELTTNTEETSNEIPKDSTAELLEAISKMQIDNYTAVYEQICTADAEKTEILTDYFVSKLSLLFDTYQSIKNEFESQENISENDALKLMFRERVSDIRTLALEECSDEAVTAVIEKFDESEIEPLLFYPAMFSRICQIARKKESCDFIDELRQKTDNIHLKAVLLAAKFSCHDEGEPPYFLIELEELAENYEFLKSCLPGDIVFNANIRGAKYCSVSFDLYMQAREGLLDEKCRTAAENSVQINNFLADMGIKGYQKIDLVTPATEAEEVYVPVSEPANDDVQPDADDSLPQDNDVNNIAESENDRVITDDTDDSENKKTSFEEPQSFRVLLKKENTEKMRASVIALASLTILLLILLVILLNGGLNT